MKQSYRTINKKYKYFQNLDLTFNERIINNIKYNCCENITKYIIEESFYLISSFSIVSKYDIEIYSNLSSYYLINPKWKIEYDRNMLKFIYIYFLSRFFNK